MRSYTDTAEAPNHGETPSPLEQLAQRLQAFKLFAQALTEAGENPGGSIFNMDRWRARQILAAADTIEARTALLQEMRTQFEKNDTLGLISAEGEHQVGLTVVDDQAKANNVYYKIRGHENGAATALRTLSPLVDEPVLITADREEIRLSELPEGWEIVPVNG